MSAAMIPLAVEALVQLIPLVRTLVDQAQNGTVPTAADIAALNTALDKADDAIQAS